MILSGLTLPTAMLPCPENWQSWSVQWSAGVPTRRLEISDDVACLPIHPSGLAVIERKSGTTVLHLEREPDENALPHPLLGLTAVVTSRWRGERSFHAGAVVVNGRVWAVLGEREAGKSSALAWSLLQGLPIFADDLLILRGGTAIAGPRCLDLRESASARFGIGQHIGVVGTRDRWRVQLDTVAPELPFAGWITLEWGDQVSVVPVPMPERLGVIAAARGLRLTERDGADVLGLLAVPMLRFTRPRDFSTLDAGMSQLLNALN